MTKHLSASLVLLAACAGAAQASDAIPADLVLADANACKKPRVAPPPPIRESAQRYNVRRRYFDLDGSGTCVLMDVWVERIGDSDSPGMRTLEHSFRHVYRGKWVPFVTSLELVPYILRSPSTGQTYLLTAPDTDIDNIIGSIVPTAYVRGQWKTTDPTMVHQYSLVPVKQGRSQLYRALAAQLAARTPADKQTPAERDRIRALEFAARDVDAGISPVPAQ
ncbi:hypothetical protein NX784_05625 [Massilia pinisoli]|uniref:Lipoprotein n=1 Tax=Massilia pinisoli TaxID=1772194 RepID=A0ABT1ZMC0_9BURK|nr:hypothetical protein [Massilia pinisoli]MCS0581063.1 hypothetical protein [Massilia pinisoli]